MEAYLNQGLGIREVEFLTESLWWERKGDLLASEVSPTR